MILDEFSHEMSNDRLPLINYFVQHQNPAISTFAINNAQINYNLSEKWTKFGVYINDERNEVRKAVDHFLLSLKDKKLTEHLSELKEELKGKDFEEAIQIQSEILKLEQSKKKLNALMGRIIIK